MKFQLPEFIEKQLKLRGKQKTVFEAIHEKCLFNKIFITTMERFTEETDLSNAEIIKALEALSKKGFIEYEVIDNGIKAKALKLANDGKDIKAFKKELINKVK